MASVEDAEEDDDDCDTAMAADKDGKPDVWRSVEDGQILVVPDDESEIDFDGDTRLQFINRWIQKVFSFTKQ
jgi:RES domain-containing protein